MQKIIDILKKKLNETRAEKIKIAYKPGGYNMDFCELYGREQAIIECIDLIKKVSNENN